jgi:hypothetical protein
MTVKIKTIDVQAKEWFDRVYGNSYFSGQVTINFGTKTAKTLYMPFQYGYGSQYEYAAMAKLIQSGIVHADDRTALFRFCDENNIVLRRNMTDKCLKREVVAFGAE